MMRFGRDLIGYGKTPPDPLWPGGAKIAVQFVLAFDEGHGEGENPSTIQGLVGSPGGSVPAGDHGARAGIWRLLRLFTDAGIPLTVHANATALARCPEQAAAMQAAGWEIASHGFSHVSPTGCAEDVLADMAEAIHLHQEVTGTRPAGWFARPGAPEAARLALSDGGFDYVTFGADDDLPYWVETSEGPKLIISYSSNPPDCSKCTDAGAVSGRRFFAGLRDAFDMLLAEGRGGAPRMLTVPLSSRDAGRPDRARALHRFLRHITDSGAAWTPRRIDIARHWASHHPPSRTGMRPSAMSKAEFIAAFARVFEHAPWVAERAHGLELGPAHDTPAGLHHALSRVFRAAAPGERRGVLLAYPDLSAKLAAARNPPADERHGPPRPGLSVLDAATRNRLAALNSAYVARHRIPFVIAEQEHDADSIARALEKRTALPPEAEFATACGEIERIARLRLEALLRDRGQGPAQAAALAGAVG